MSRIARFFLSWFIALPVLAVVGIVLGYLVFFNLYPGKPQIGVITIPFVVINEDSAFAREFDEILESWNGFHRDFDDWMDSEGGCDRSEVIQTLGEMSVEFGSLADRVRDLPTASYLRPCRWGSASTLSTPRMKPR